MSSSDRQLKSNKYSDNDDRKTFISSTERYGDSTTNKFKRGNNNKQSLKVKKK